MKKEEMYVKGGNIRFRKATLKDLDKIQRIERVSFRNPYPTYYTKALIESLSDVSIVAEINDRVVGYVFARVEFGAVGHIITIAVDPAFRGLGIGKSLMIEALRLLRERGCRSVYLEVRVSNEPAINLYRKLGFVIKRRIRGYYKDGEDAFLMERQI